MIKLPVKRKGRFRKGDRHPIKSAARLQALSTYRPTLGSNRNPDGKAGKPHIQKRKRLELLDRKRHQLEMHELQALARENASAVMQALIDISLDERAMASSRIAAGAVVLERGYGKATQISMSASLNNGKTNELTGDELDKRIGKALERVEDITRRGSKEEKSKNRPADVRVIN